MILKYIFVLFFVACVTLAYGTKLRDYVHSNQLSKVPFEKPMSLFSNHNWKSKHGYRKGNRRRKKHKNHSVPDEPVDNLKEHKRIWSDVYDQEDPDTLVEIDAKEIANVLGSFHTTHACDRLFCSRHELCIEDEDSGVASCISRKSMRKRNRKLKQHTSNKEIPSTLEQLEDSETVFHDRVKRIRDGAQSYGQFVSKKMANKIEKVESELDKDSHLIPRGPNGHKTGHDKGQHSHDHKKKHSSDKTQENSVIQQKIHRTCTQGDLEEIGRRFLDWFKLLQDDEKASQHHGKSHHKTKRNSHKRELLSDDSCRCQSPVSWQFQQLDVDVNGSLDIAELEEIEDNTYEHCAEPYIQSCDTDRDGKITENEWCCCFSDVVPPCLLATQQELPTEMSRFGGSQPLVGGFVPRCDNDGFYHPRQCHSSTGLCWCVDRNGHKLPGTETRGRPQCGFRQRKNGI